MAQIHPGRFTADVTEALGDADEFVVFVIGMRVNKPWKIHRWLPVAKAMTIMMNELVKHPDKGLLGYRSMGFRTTTMIQYWKSFEHLERFAHDKDDPHLQAWRDFNAKVGVSDDLGVYHETYRVKTSDYECIYSNMPVMGLAKATAHAPVARRGNAARERLAAGSPVNA
jgi:hypothetical protein